MEKKTDWSYHSFAWPSDHKSQRSFGCQKRSLELKHTHTEMYQNVEPNERWNDEGKTGGELHTHLESPLCAGARQIANRWRKWLLRWTRCSRIGLKLAFYGWWAQVAIGEFKQRYAGRCWVDAWIQMRILRFELTVDGGAADAIGCVDATHEAGIRVLVQRTKSMRRPEISFARLMNCLHWLCNRWPVHRVVGERESCRAITKRTQWEDAANSSEHTETERESIAGRLRTMIRSSIS